MKRFEPRDSWILSHTQTCTVTRLSVRWYRQKRFLKGLDDDWLADFPSYSKAVGWFTDLRGEPLGFGAPEFSFFYILNTPTIGFQTLHLRRHSGGMFLRSQRAVTAYSPSALATSVTCLPVTTWRPNQSKYQQWLPKINWYAMQSAFLLHRSIKPTPYLSNMGPMHSLAAAKRLCAPVTRSFRQLDQIY